MQTLRYWQVIIEDKLPDIYEVLKKASYYKNSDIKASANNLRQFLEGTIDKIIEYENLTIEKKLTLDNQIAKLNKEEKIDNQIKNKLKKIKDIGNDGSHFYGNITVEKLVKAFEIIKEFADYFVSKYIKHIIEEESDNKEQDEMPELQKNEIYVYECLKPECKREIKDKNIIKVCKKCGGPIKYKTIDANYIEVNIEPVTEHRKPKIPMSSIKPPRETKHKFEIYDLSLELVKEVKLNKDEIIIGRTSSKFKDIDIDLKDLAIDENGNYLISKLQAKLYKSEDYYYIENMSEKVSLSINDEYLQCNKGFTKLEHKDLIVLNNFIALLYIKY